MADRRYQVLMNGRALCTAGVDDIGVLITTLAWVKRKRRADDEVQGDADILESHWLTVGGSDSVSDVFLKWSEEPLNPGDEITIRILGPGPVDEPMSEPSP